MTVLIFSKIFVKGNHEFPTFAIHITSGDLPVGSGLGSSAAFCVTIATAFLLYGKQLQLQDSNGWLTSAASINFYDFKVSVLLD